MQLDYIPNYNNYGENIVRLSNFDMAEAKLFRDTIKKELLLENKIVDVSLLPFVDAKNCVLKLRLSEEDEGILTMDEKQFFCCLTATGFTKLLLLIEPFCIKESKAYQWLYDLDNENSFLFSPSSSQEE